MASKKYLELVEFSNEDLASELQQTEAQYEKLKFDHAIKVKKCKWLKEKLEKKERE